VLHFEIECGEFNADIKNIFGKIDDEVFSETLSLIINKQCTKAFQLKLTPDDVKQKWDDVEDAIGKSIQFLRTHLKVKAYSYLPYRDMLALIAYYFYNCKGSEIDKNFLEQWFWKAAFSNRYSGSSFTKIGEDRAYIFDPVISGEPSNINYSVNLDIEKIKDVNMGRSTALRNALFLILIQEIPLSFLDNSPIDLEADPVSEFNSSEKHHIFPKKFLSSIGIKEKKLTDLFLNFCLIDSALNKNISGKAPQDYFGDFSRGNPNLKNALDSHLIPSEKESAVWANDYKTFLEQRANLILMQVKKRIGDFSASIEEEMHSDPASLVHRVEQSIRSVINDMLYNTYGENWWDSENTVPQDIKNDVSNKIKKEKARKPYVSDEEWNLPIRKLEHLNIMDYPKIILKNWNVFEEVFGTKGQVEKYFDGFSSIRNHIDHLRTIDPVERKFGETSIEWILRCIQRKAEVEENTKLGDEFLVNEIYEETRTRILALDPDIIEKERASRKVFAKNNLVFNFVTIRFRRDHILVRVILGKGQLNDPRSICVDKTRADDKANRRIFFEVRSLADIDYSMEIIRQAYEFNESYISKKHHPSSRGEAYRAYFQELIDELREKHKFTGARVGQPQNWYSFSSGLSGVLYSAVFVMGGKTRVELYIDQGDAEQNKRLFDKLKESQDFIEEEMGEKLEWERLDDKRASRIAIYRPGSIDSDPEELKSIQAWQVEHLLKFKRVLLLGIKKIL
jgi:predicted transport protein